MIFWLWFYMVLPACMALAESHHFLSFNFCPLLRMGIDSSQNPTSAYHILILKTRQYPKRSQFLKDFPAMHL